MGQNRTYQTGLNVREKEGHACMPRMQEAPNGRAARQDAEARPAQSVCNREGHAARKNTHLNPFTHFRCKLNYASRTTASYLSGSCDTFG